MESNKEEARIALDIADRKLSKNDYHGAKKLAIKAQTLYPKLDGLEQVLKMIDVYLYASNKINGARGEPDWYGILGVDPLADDDAVKKRYKKLALLLHPDKNRFTGAEGAFKVVLEAWDLLSDKAKRIAYDRKRRSDEISHRPTKRRKSTSESKPYGDRPEPNHERKNPEQKPEHKPKPEPKHEHKKPEPKPPETKTKTKTKTKPKPEPERETETKPKPKPKPENLTFWTVCSSNRCKTYWEFKRDCLNKTLTCQNCCQCFVGTEVIPVVHNGRPVIIMSPCNQPMRKNTFSTSASNSAAKRMRRWFDANPELDSSSKKKETSIFWTVCSRCKTLCKLLRANSPNKTLACPYCSEDFPAAEIIPYIVNGRPVIISSHLPSGQSSSKNTSSDASSSSTTSEPASAKPKTADQRIETLKSLFPELREKIDADFAAAGENANVATRIYKKMKTGNKNSALETETFSAEPITTGSAYSSFEAQILFWKAMTT